MSWRGPVGTLAVLVTAMLVLAAPASAVHLFPATPSFDPAGHDCAKNLVAAPPGAAETVSVSGFSFSDSSRDSETSIVAGDSITWRWGPDHCHSVTFGGSLGGTRGAEGFQPADPALVRLNGPGQDSFTLRFDEPGTFEYVCTHHASVGMRGRVVVAPRPGAGQPEPEADRTAPQAGVALGRTTLQKVVRQGFIPVNVTCDEASTIALEAVVSRKLGRRLGGRKIASGNGACQAGSRTTVRLKLTRKARRGLRRRKSVALTLTGTATDAAGNAGTATRKGTLKRKR